MCLPYPLPMCLPCPLPKWIGLPSLCTNPRCAAAPKAHKQSQFYCVKQSQLCCVRNHEQPRRGVSLLASTEQPVYRLSPLSPEGKGDLGESGGAPSLRVKKGTGDVFRELHKRAHPPRKNVVPLHREKVTTPNDIRSLTYCNTKFFCWWFFCEQQLS